MSVICVTGRMAAGKNYVCVRYEKQGWISIDADKVVHEAVEVCKHEILEAFSEVAKSKGVPLLDGNGKIIRKNLGGIIFDDAELLKKQEGIVYPYVTKHIRRFIEEHSGATGAGNIIINATVLYKTPELLRLCEKIVFVKASFLKRLVRAKKRDGLPLKKILARFDQQKKLLSFYITAGRENGIPIEIVKN